MRGNYVLDLNQSPLVQAALSAEERNRRAAEERVRNQDLDGQGEEGMDAAGMYTAE